MDIAEEPRTVEGAALAEHVLRHAPDVRILATGRRVLGAEGEQVVIVPPLSLPSPGRAPSLETLLASETVALLVERATAVRPGFAVTEDNQEAVARLRAGPCTCRRLPCTH